MRLAERLELLGHEVVEEDPRYGPIGPAFVPRSMAGVRDLAARVPDPALLDARTRANVRGGLLLGGEVLRAARAAEAPLRRRIGEMFWRFDAVLTPTTAVPPLRTGDLEGLSVRDTNSRMIAACPYAWPWNVLGWPAISVPSGFTDAGLPMGAQLLGPSNSEPLLISLAAQLEVVGRWYERWPPGLPG